MSKKLVVGNWKMNAPKNFRLPSFRKVEVVICPPFVYFDLVKKMRLTLGAQNVFYEREGAYTGEVSAAMLKNSGVKYVIVGHSERRALPARLGGGETDEVVSKKVRACLKAGLIPIVCVGETHRDDNSYHSFIKEQINNSLKGVSKNEIKRVVVAYEPVWAIGRRAKRSATPEECGEMIIFIRKTLADLFGPAVATRIRILYGGSVELKNAAAYISAGAQGLLVGRDSLDPKKFGEIIKTVELI